MRQLMLTAKTTLLPANHSLDTKKGLHSNERLDDSLGRACIKTRMGRSVEQFNFLKDPIDREISGTNT